MKTEEQELLQAGEEMYNVLANLCQINRWEHKIFRPLDLQVSTAKGGKVITIIKPHNESFILDGKEYDLVAATCTYTYLEEVMDVVAKELLPEDIYKMYKKMFMEILILKSILRY